MSKFSLDKFIKKPSENPRFPLPEGIRVGSVYESLFNAAVERIESIERSLKSSPPEDIEKMDVKEYKIVIEHLITAIGRERGSIRMDRSGELPKFISEQNKRLERVWQSKLPKGEGKRPTRKDLDEKVTELKNDLEKEKQKNFHEFFDRVVESKILTSHKSLSDRLIEMESLYKAEQDKNAILHQKINGLIRELNSK